jgi:hypothetical protein
MSNGEDFFWKFLSADFFAQAGFGRAVTRMRYGKSRLAPMVPYRPRRDMTMVRFKVTLGFR